MTTTPFENHNNGPNSMRVPSADWLRWLLPLVLVLTLIVFGRALGFEFVDWDDDVNILRNPLYHPFTPDGLAKVWSGPHNDQYMPVMWSLWGILANIATLATPVARIGAAPSPVSAFPFHLLALGMHLVNVVLVYHLLRRLLNGNTLATAVGTLLFALHPLQTEAAVWVNGGNITTAYAFGLSSLLLFLHAAEGDVSRRSERLAGFIGATALFLLAVLTKPTAICLIPFVGLILLASPHRYRGVVLPLVLWSVLAFALTALGWMWSRGSQSVSVPPLQRVLIAGDTLVFYFKQILFPRDLAMDYGRTPTVALATPTILFTWLIPILIGLLLWRLRQRTLLLAFALFVAALLPTLGFVPFYYQQISTVADRYVYLALFGAALAVGHLAAQTPPRIATLVALLLITGCGSLSFWQTHTWSSTPALYEHALTINPEDALLHYNLANSYFFQGRRPEAEAHYRRAIALRPSYYTAYVNLGDLLAGGGRTSEAQEQYRSAIALAPKRPEAQSSLGLSYASQGKLEQAIPCLRTAVEAEPDNPATRYNLAQMLLDSGQRSEALLQFQETLKRRPNFAPAQAALQKLTPAR